MTGAYREHDVHRGLEAYVACYWSKDIGGHFQRSQPVLPDGCIDLLFASGAESLNVVGTMTRTLWTEDRSPTQFVGIRFKPGGAVPFLRDRADLFTDQMVDAESVFGPAVAGLWQQLMQSVCLETRVHLLEAFLLRQLQAGLAEVDPRIAWATSSLVDDPASKIELLACQLGMSRQYVRRLFLRHTGLAPKAFARVARLGKLIGALQAGTQLVDAAVASGYADQAHMSHEFKGLVGIAPAAYRSRA